MTGTPEQIADALESWFHAGRRRRLQHHAADPADRVGRTSSTTSCPNSSARGLFRTEYTGTTLRDHYGLSRPADHFSEPVLASA